MASDCLLCTAEQLTEWVYEDDEIWIADCIVCLTPMVVWKQHDLPAAEIEVTLLARLEPIAAQRYPDGWWLDGERRRIPEHWHAHARPAGGFFDPRSDLYGTWEGPIAESASPSEEA